MLTLYALWVSLTPTCRGLTRPLCAQEALRTLREWGDRHSGHPYWAHLLYAHALTSCQTALTKHKFKDKTSKNFKTETAEHSITCAALCAWDPSRLHRPHREAVPRRWTCTKHRRSESRARALTQQVLLTLWLGPETLSKILLYLSIIYTIKIKTVAARRPMSPASSFCRQGRSSLKSQDESLGALGPDLLNQTVNRNTTFPSLHHPFPAHWAFGCSLFLSCAIAILLTPFGADEVDSHPPHQGPARGLRQAWQSSRLCKDLTSAVGTSPPPLESWGTGEHEIMEHLMANLLPCREGMSENKVNVEESRVEKYRENP